MPATAAQDADRHAEDQGDRRAAPDGRVESLETGDVQRPWPPLARSRVQLAAEALVRPGARSIGYLRNGPLRRRRQRHFGLGIPAPRRSVRTAVHVFMDELVLSGFHVVRKRPDDAMLERVIAEAAAAAELYEARGWIADPRSFHPEPKPLHGVRERELRSGRLVYEELSFVSDYVPHPGEPGRERWLRYRSNHVARAHVLRHGDGPRPWVVAVHGTAMGRADIDLRAFRALRLFRDLGCNVLLPVLPLHGRRVPRQSPGAEFPTIDLVDNVHGLAQAAADVRRLLLWVREQEPSGIALTGMSLGGYVAALVAGLERTPFDAVVPCVPVVDFPAVFHRQLTADLREHPGYLALAEPGRVIHEVVSPLRFEPATPPHRRFIFAGLADRLLEPTEQPSRLWEHWGWPDIRWFEGGHVGHVMSRELMGYLEEVLDRCGVSAPHGIVEPGSDAGRAPRELPDVNVPPRRDR